MAKTRSQGTQARTAPALSNMLNLGPASAQMLADAGIESRAELEELGAVGAYVTVYRKASGSRPTLNLLYALEGALRNIPWTKLPHHVRASLTLEADAILSSEGVGS
jgi:hypothetical protein